MKTHFIAKKKAVWLVATLIAATLALSLTRTSLPQAALAQAGAAWTVSVTIHELEDLDDNDAAGAYDFYQHVVFSTDPLIPCDNEEEFIEGYNISPNWICSRTLSGADPMVYATIWIYDDDWPSADDLIDINPAEGGDNSDRTMAFWFWPATHRLNIQGLDDDNDGETDEDGELQCARSRIEMAGTQEDRARIVFTVTGTVEGAQNGDSDGDGLTDAEELCGIDRDNDGTFDVDLLGMGADPFRKDLFVEVDWMVDSDGVAPADHGHEPWLPSLINAWHEFDQAPVTNPPAPDGVARRGGIAFHADTGQLYANYALDFDGDGVDEISVDGSGNMDVDPDGPGGPQLPDGLVDIGNLGTLGAGTPGGGNRVCANLAPAPCPAGQLGEFSPLPSAAAGPNNDASDAMALNFVANRAPAFRYTIFAHLSNVGGNSGWSPWGTLDFIVSLGGAANQGGGLVGPAGLPVQGSIGQHTGTFLHELGHSLGLEHGGGDSLNRKPNYISIMSYDHQFRGVNYDLDGDGLAESLIGFDFDQDGLPDGQRYTYSMDEPAAEDNLPFTGLRGGLPPLQENALDEPEGIGDGQAIVFYGPSLDLNGDGLCDICTFSALGNQPIDWNRDGDALDLNVSVLASPPNPAGNSTDLNRDGNGAAGQLLTGFNDYNFLQNNPLKGLSLEEDDAFVRSLVRATGLSEAQVLAACDPQTSAIINFDELAPGSAVSSQYAAQGVTFVADDLRQPTVAGPEARSELPTWSLPNSLVNAPVPPADSEGVPLVITFDPPVRIVSLRLGRVTVGNPAKDVAILTAFDADGFSMGSVQRAIPDFNQGITAYLATGAIFPQLPISRVELNYALNPISNPLEPEHIDDLVICRDVFARQPVFPDQPEFGDQTVDIDVAVEVRYPMATGDEVEPRLWQGAALSDVTIQWERPNAGENDSADTPFSLALNEGEQLKLTATTPNFHRNWGALTFLYWREGSNIYFPSEDVEMTTRVLRNTSFTAVYRSDLYRTYLPVVKDQSQPGGPTATPALSLTPARTSTRTTTSTHEATATTSIPASTMTPTPTATHTPTPSASATSTQTPVTVVLTPIGDAYISLADPDTNYGLAPILYVGKSDTTIGRSLFQFNLEGIPSGATVIAASFRAYLVASLPTPPLLDVELRRNDDPWVEMSVTWNTQPGAASIGKVNGVGLAPMYYEWEVTGLVQEWVNGSTANDGLALWSFDETTLGWRGFASRESASPPNPPQLVVMYQP